jgi:hypothetical protein
MRMLLSVFSVAVLLAASGCATDRYPLSGEKCGPDDPVKTMTAPPCPPAA